MLRLGIDPPKLDLMKPMLSARPRVRILAICIGEFSSDSLKFEALEVQELEDTTLLQLHPSYTFRLFTIVIT
jgi:hypothetical protein